MDDQMPIATIKLDRGRSAEDKRKLAKALTDAVANTHDLKPEWVTVLIEEFERQNRATGGAENCTSIDSAGALRRRGLRMHSGRIPRGFRRGQASAYILFPYIWKRPAAGFGEIK